MNPIDLVEFAEHSQKLPASYLAPESKKTDFKLWKVFATHYLDFSAAFVTTILMSAMFNESLKMFLVTKGLQKAWSDNVVFGFSVSILPMMVFSYFFFSYFMNHGQTWGMFLFKKRFNMKSHSFKDAALWACYSMALCFTCGLSYFIEKNKWKNFSSQDYLYDNLMAHRVLSPVQLLNEIEKFDSVPEVVEEDIWVKAA